MKSFILRTYDYLSTHRGLAAAILLALVGLCILGASRIHYEEDISAFLPMDENTKKYSDVYMKLGGDDRIALFFEKKDEGDDSFDPADDIILAMETFQEVWAEVDSTGMVPSFETRAGGGNIDEVFSFIAGNYPYFLREEDYSRMEALLEDPSFVERKISSDKQSLYGAAPTLATRYLRSDPLGLFSPVLERLSDLNPTKAQSLVDGYLFTGDGRTGVAFMTSPFGQSETGNNTRLISLLDKAKSLTMERVEGVSVFSTGGPEVAVENSTRIKKDSFMAVGLALVLILLVLLLSFRRIDDVIWIAVSILCGALFSLGLISLYKSTISVIVLGIGSTIIGIAVNYPLHYVDHLKFRKDSRKALADQINPLLVGNITTVGAFLSLMFLKADALHDFGFIGAATLVGTILFVLFFLPVFVKAEKKDRNAIRLDFDRFINPSQRARRIFLFCFLALSVVMYYHSRRVEFDSDMHNINYMTREQARGFEILSELGADGTDGTERIYLVSEGSTPDEALSASEKFLGSLENEDILSIRDFLPSRGEQLSRLQRWRDFISAHPDLSAQVVASSLREGFTREAFSPFENLLSTSFEPRDIDYFSPIASSIASAMYLPGENEYSVVGYLSVPKDRVEKAKEDIRSSAKEGDLCFSSSDLGGRLSQLLNEDFDYIGLICSLIVFLFLWFSFGRLELSLVTFLPLAFGWFWILGLMHLWGVKFNIVNIILATFIFGQGDDYSIFITEGLMYERAYGKRILSSFKNTVVLSALVMFLGIGTLITARHPAMRSLATVTIIGMFIVVAMAYYLPPLVYRWMTTHRGEQRLTPITIPRLLLTGYVILVVFVFMVLLHIFTFLFFLGGDSDRKSRIYRIVLQKLCSGALRIIPGCRYTTSNPHGEDFSRSAIYICNHQSHLDALALLSLNPKISLVTNNWVWRSPVYGYLIRKAGFHPMSDGVEKNMERFRELRDKGYSIAIFPEGTRSEDCSIQRFHRGAFVAAKELGMDILPLYIHGFGYALPKKEFLMRKAGLYLEIGERIHPESIPEDIRAFTRAVRAQYIETYRRIREERETVSYIRPFVKYQYLYRGTDSWNECRRVLSDRKFLKEASSPIKEETITVEDCGFGVRTLVLSLSHPRVHVVGKDSDEEKILCAGRLPGLPPNLEYILTDKNKDEDGREI